MALTLTRCACSSHTLIMFADQVDAFAANLGPNTQYSMSPMGGCHAGLESGTARLLLRDALLGPLLGCCLAAAWRPTCRGSEPRTAQAASSVVLLPVGCHFNANWLHHQSLYGLHHVNYQRATTGPMIGSNRPFACPLRQASQTEPERPSLLQVPTITGFSSLTVGSALASNCPAVPTAQLFTVEVRASPTPCSTIVLLLSFQP